MSLKIVVLAKQVPDTRNVGKDAMKADGTINRAALPAIFNPEDLNALEQALRLKDAHPGSTVTILTMGPGRAAEVIREGLYRGADNGYLLTDRAFAGADTLATSYALATAIRKIGDYDIIIGGRQAIDGDTAQVGPQVAEKLGLTQVTYAEEILNVDKAAGKITVKRHIDGGVETVEGPLPIVITVNGSAAPCRPHVPPGHFAQGSLLHNFAPLLLAKYAGEEGDGRGQVGRHSPAVFLGGQVDDQVSLLAQGPRQSVSPKFIEVLAAVHRQLGTHLQPVRGHPVKGPQQAVKSREQTQTLGHVIQLLLGEDPRGHAAVLNALVSQQSRGQASP